jgi:phosphatidate cytidylyltransferase
MLKQRIVTAALALAIVLAILLFGGSISWKVLVWLGCLVCVYEFSNMVKCHWWSAPAVWGYIVITFVQWCGGWHTPLAIEVMGAVTLALPVLSKNRYSILQCASVLLGAMYIGYGGRSLVLLRELPHGLAWVLVFLISIWMTDTFAFFTGRALKGPKLWPSISPQKTVSGAIGGIAGSILGTLLVALSLLRHEDVGFLVILGILISVAGQLGDFVESAYKRSAGVKDSGGFFPGHGGMLDRVDSLIYASPFVFAFISHHLQGLLWS